MFKDRTVFVLGAGSSKEVEMPLGSELIPKISQMLNFHFSRGNRVPNQGDATIYDTLVRIAKTDVNSFIAASRKISEGILLDTSIDSFLDKHRDDPQIQMCGKLAIVKSILEAERQSSLYVDATNASAHLDPSKVSGTWFDRFLKVLSEGVTRADLGSLFNGVSLINFNYDRCIEQYLAHAIQKLYAISFEQAGEVLRKLKILRPYGSIGPLPWQTPETAFAYGSPDIGPEGLVALAAEIRTYSERVHESQPLWEIQGEIAHAQTIIYLGCAYHPQNMQILTPAEKLSNAAARIFGTAKDISEPGIQVVKNRIATIASVGGRGIAGCEIRDCTCSKLFQEYGILFSKG